MSERVEFAIEIALLNKATEFAADQRLHSRTNQK
jgi:hypothetical protein